MLYIVLGSIGLIGLASYLFVNRLRSTPYGKLHLAEAIFLRYVAKSPNRFEIPAPKQRQYYKYFREQFPEAHVHVDNVMDKMIPGLSGDIPIRIYAPSQENKLPVLVYFHGGGWVIGDLDSHDHVCRLLSKEANIIVVAVDYRLAPEHKFPDGFDDSYTATVWVAAHANSFGGNPDRIAVGGDSAGGNIAAAICLRSRDNDGPKIKFQLLIYPATDLSRETSSKLDFAEGYLLSKNDMDYFGAALVHSESDYLNPYVSPLLACKHIGLPSAFVFTAGFDPLRDEGKAYANKLSDAGVDVVYKNYEGTIHGFFGKGKFKQSAIAVKDAIQQLNTKL